MSRGWLASGWLVCAVALLAACGSGQPEITVETTHHNLGDIPQDQVATLTVPVLNTGQHDLEIKAVATSCGCTTAQIEPKVIPPGGVGELIVRYDPGLHADIGQIQRHIYIVSNDPVQEELEVIVTANVQGSTGSHRHDE